MKMSIMKALILVTKRRSSHVRCAPVHLMYATVHIDFLESHIGKDKYRSIRKRKYTSIHRPGPSGQRGGADSGEWGR